MFAAVVAGRLPQTDFQPVDQNKFLLTIDKAESIHHLIIFLTGAQALPDNSAAALFFSLPDPSSPPAWTYLGFISNEKPSAIFKVSNLQESSRQQQECPLSNGSLLNNQLQISVNPSAQSFNFAQAPVAHFAQIGVSIQPTSEVLEMVSQSGTQVSKVESFVEYANKTATSLFNYCSSFAVTLADLAAQSGNMSPSETFVRISVLQRWYETHMKKLEMNPNFWKN